MKDGIKFHLSLVSIVIIVAVVYVFFNCGKRVVYAKGNTASGSSAWGSGGSGWQRTSTAGQNPGVARSPIAQTSGDPGAIPRYTRGAVAREMSPLVPGLAGLGGLRPTNMAGSRPASQGPVRTLPVDPGVAVYRWAQSRLNKTVGHIRRSRPYYS